MQYWIVSLEKSNNTRRKRIITMDENDKNRKADLLITTFSEKPFLNKVNQYRDDIEFELKAFLEWLVNELNANQPFFRSPESRIKSKSSFEEKLYRKDYINKWKVDGKAEDIQQEIMLNLPDLIGFRITCFFMDDEKVIYDKLRQYYEDGKLSNITLDFSEGTQQKNGKIIYKVSGKYKDEVCFEVQIKAATHNVWGEVEHRTIYKGKQYHILEQSQQNITDEIYNVLRSSDHQLLELFSSQYTQDDLIHALFAEMTREKVSNIVKTEFLAEHYSSFFDIFYSTDKEKIREYVSKTIVDLDSYDKQEKQSDEPDKNEIELIDLIKKKFIEYYINVQYQIMQMLYDFKGYDEFLLYLVRTLTPRKDECDEVSLENDAFSEEDPTSNKEELKDIIIKVLSMKLPKGALKEGDY